jgi:hypothetical protein
MTCTTNLHIARSFSRTDTNAPKGHPLRGSIRKTTAMQSEELITAIKREHLLQKDDYTPERTRLIVIRDTVISVMGAISAMVPILIAIQSAAGA